MNFTISEAKNLLQNVYLEMIKDVMEGKELPTAEEKAAEIIEKIDAERLSLKK